MCSRRTCAGKWESRRKRLLCWSWLITCASNITLMHFVIEWACAPPVYPPPADDNHNNNCVTCNSGGGQLFPAATTATTALGLRREAGQHSDLGKRSRQTASGCKSELPSNSTHCTSAACVTQRECYDSEPLISTQSTVCHWFALNSIQFTLDSSVPRGNGDQASKLLGY